METGLLEVVVACQCVRIAVPFHYCEGDAVGQGALLIGALAKQIEAGVKEFGRGRDNSGKWGQGKWGHPFCSPHQTVGPQWCLWYCRCGLR